MMPDPPPSGPPGGGTIIIGRHARTALSDPAIHDALPPATKLLVDAVFDKAEADWTAKDRKIIGNAISWALTNIK
jgi:hypothetical protein